MNPGGHCEPSGFFLIIKNLIEITIQRQQSTRRCSLQRRRGRCRLHTSERFLEQMRLARQEFRGKNNKE